MKKFLAIVLMMTLLVAVLPAGALAASKTTVYRTTASSLNVREGAGTKYDVIGSVKKGTAFTVTKKSGNWYKIKALRTGKTGWISKNYTTTRAYARVATNHKGLNIRSTPVAYDDWRNVKGSAPKNAKVLVKYIQGNWAYVTYAGISGWSSRTWLKWVA